MEFESSASGEKFLRLLSCCWRTREEETPTYQPVQRRSRCLEARHGAHVRDVGDFEGNIKIVPLMGLQKWNKHEVEGNVHTLVHRSHCPG